MRSRRLVAAFMLVGLFASLSPHEGIAIGGPGHLATGTGVLPGGATLGITAGDVGGVGGLGLATLTPPGGNPTRILLTCVVINVPATGLSTGHTLGASGTGSDLATYYLTITDSGATGFADTAGISTTAGTGACGGPPAAPVPGDPYLILL